ncbi:CDP-diacylglycerol--glycerol-3-phosphate 3-phosphatidyltransferase [Isoptericola sp. CG 20/1183]|uniref:CDP-diacylglycerol--glycerol-3-phosphate 3-phosphatidyltransferase n=1 Tax=Isoptericola halotolerans TaxID=300560 RepID=A0ABX5ECQ6_9MICO|nr:MULTISPECIES: CDP-diacylglycerol--glycerol-3-phosphate 3-phosphatidyltransferase [Isoptericola]MCK0116660.1 CDP-diacylglycerol--glycerol-3-phosphate 3-phosphatidyltransferase [Isoptericola sp. S6320L]PRZ05626.1 CDP-diacylglycerol--glycerol-3-phosphate 3-phosphatidyltransferase [Isoptericola halotolerans]PRZ06194.1 CDP-diacylglycerol--glycerol-3-phosphate 3-phosphatidyltransferase [Isoptericola sp. CG 20/1183]
MDATPSPWNIANLVTMVRIALVPVFAWALLVDDGQSVTWRLVATGIFAVAAVSDKVDGHLARSRGLVTDLGKILDPIADKALVGAALVLLWWPLGELPWWVPAVILVRELGITAMRMGMLRYAVMPASRGGKIKTVLQIAAILLFLLPLDHLHSSVLVLAWVVMGAAIAVTVVTGVDYVVQGWRIRRDARRPERAG